MIPFVKKSFDAFIDAQGISKLQASEQYEIFAEHALLAAEVADEAELADAHLGGAQKGIDSILIQVNGIAVSGASDISVEALNLNPQARTVITFIQTKTSDNIKAVDLQGFLAEVRRILESAVGLDQHYYPSHEQVIQRMEAIQALYDVLHEKGARLPEVRAIAVTGGNHEISEDQSVALREFERLVNGDAIWSKVSATLVNGVALVRHWLTAGRRAECSIDFEKRQIVPPAPGGVDEAYIGVILATQFLQIIQTPEGNLRQGIFDANVRDYQGLNSVNAGMIDTLSGKDKNLFPIFNNGVTIVAEDLSTTGVRMRLSGYQIVNGCQTSNVIHEASKKGIDLSDVFIPIKIVKAGKLDIFGQVSVATNSQTAVSAADLTSLNEFAKNVESFFELNSQIGLVYERRKGMYSNKEIYKGEKTRIISPMILMRSYVAAALQQPDAATANLAQLYTRVPNDIMNPKHEVELYLAASALWYKIDVLFRTKRDFSHYSSGRWQIMAAMANIALEGSNYCSVKEHPGWAKRILETVASEDLFEARFQAALDAVNRAADGEINRDRAKGQGFYERVVALLVPSQSNVGPGERQAESAEMRRVTPGLSQRK